MAPPTSPTPVAGPNEADVLAGLAPPAITPPPVSVAGLEAVVPAVAPVEPPTEPPASRSRRAILRSVVPLLLLVVGLAAGTARQFAHQPEPMSLAPASPPLPTVELTPADRIDAAIREALYEDGLKLCRTAPKETFGDRDAPLAYREALCREGLGQWAEAAEAYRKAADPDGDVACWAAALLGQARCAAARGEISRAAEFVSRVILRSGDPACRERRVLDDCLHLRGQLAVQQLGTQVTPDPFEPEAVAWPPLLTRSPPPTDWLPGRSRPATARPVASTQRERIRVARSSDSPEQITLSAELPNAPAGVLLREVATAAGFQVQATASASICLAGHSTALHIEGLPLDEFLSALTEPHGVTWTLDGTILNLRTHEGLPPEVRRARASRALRRAVEAAPGHPLARAAQLGLANLEYQDGGTRRAMTSYRQLLDREPYSAETLYAAYNLALLELKSGDLVSARAHFLEVVDRNPGGRWEALAWWWTGRSYLDIGDPRAALRPLRTALNSSDKEVRSAAGLGIALCHILQGDDATALAALVRRRPGPDDRHATLAAWLEAWLRYRMAPSETRGATLTAALRLAQDGRSLGPVGVFLAGESYRDLGMGQKMLELYERESPSLRGPLAVRMTLATGDHLAAEDRLAPARERYLAVLAADPEGLGLQAELRLAELAAQEGHGPECIRRCWRLINRPEVDRNRVLATLGRGYELVGQYRQAAECFAGRVPSEQGNPSAE